MSWLAWAGWGVALVLGIVLYAICRIVSGALSAWIKAWLWRR